MTDVRLRLPVGLGGGDKANGERATVPAKPSKLVTLMVERAEEPAAMSRVGGVASSEKLGNTTSTLMVVELAKPPGIPVPATLME